jgi:pimeloyl-ACP methyl ester carboxylesterase
MRDSIAGIREALRLTTISDSIIWGNANFQTRSDLAISSDGRAYTVQNLHYAASLLEAHAEKRDTGLPAGEGVPRANRILEKILGFVTAGTHQSAEAGSVEIPRVHGLRADPLSEWRARQDVMSVLMFLHIHADRLGLSPSALAQVDRVLALILASEEQSRESKSPVVRGRSLRDAEPKPFRDAPPSLESLKRKLPGGYHWVQALTAIADFPDLDWPIPVPKTCPVLDICDERKCYAAPRGSTERTIAVKFFRGDWKPLPAPRPLPVIFVSGWQAQLTNLKQKKSGYGFTGEQSFSTAPPPTSMPGGGDHPLPPPPLFSAGWSVPRDFPGLVNHLRRAGYPHARFRMSHPADHIQIAVDELYGVVELAKKVFQVDKVILVGHSRGGLIVRKYILDRWTHDQTIDVAKVITYGTPHLGAQLANVGEEVIINGVLMGLAGPIIATNLNLLLDAIDLIPEAGPQITNEIESAMVGALADLMAPILDSWRAFFESGEELKTNSPFIAALNDAYAAQVVPRDERLISLWEAIDHVLIAGTSPSFFKAYVGSWWPLDPVGISLLQLGDICFHTAKMWGAQFQIPYHCWHWHWYWHPLLDFLPGVSSDLDAAISIAAGGPTIVKAFHDDLGDGVVETTSALAEGVAGNIRRTQFKLQHFNIKTNDEVSGHHEAPSSYQVVVKPWELLFVELGVPFSETTRCEGAELRPEWGGPSY